MLEGRLVWSSAQGAGWCGAVHRGQAGVEQCIGGRLVWSSARGQAGVEQCMSAGGTPKEPQVWYRYAKHKTDTVHHPTGTKTPSTNPRPPPHPCLTSRGLAATHPHGPPATPSLPYLRLCS